MIRNAAGFDGTAWKCQDDMWRIRVTHISGRFLLAYPLSPDGFPTQALAESWWRVTDTPITCRVCGTQFFAARDDAMYCTPKCRAKYNRHQQGASEHQYTGAYYQRDEHDRTHTRQKDTFEYQCEYCQKTNTARSEAHRAGKRVPKYCNDNGGKCRQAAYRAAKKSAKQNERDKASHDTHQTRHNGPRRDDPPYTRTETSKNGAPTHSGRWTGQFDCMAYLAAAYRYNHSGTQAAWAKANNVKDAIAWAKRYITANHPDKTGKPADTLYKTISDCYSFIRKRA